MNRKEILLKRLEEIGISLKQSGNALALLGLGSVGTELERMDEYSDLDFFAIVKKGHKQKYIENIHWLASIQTIDYIFAKSFRQPKS